MDWGAFAAGGAVGLAAAVILAARFLARFLELSFGAALWLCLLWCLPTRRVGRRP